MLLHCLFRCPLPSHHLLRFFRLRRPLFAVPAVGGGIHCKVLDKAADGRLSGFAERFHRRLSAAPVCTLRQEFVGQLDGSLFESITMHRIAVRISMWRADRRPCAPLHAVMPSQLRLHGCSLPAKITRIAFLAHVRKKFLFLALEQPPGRSDPTGGICETPEPL